MGSYIFILAAIFIGTLLCKRGTTILNALQLSVMTYCFAWLGYLLLSGCTVLLEIILTFIGFDVHWSEVISRHYLGNSSPIIFFVLMVFVTFLVVGSYVHFVEGSDE